MTPSVMVLYISVWEYPSVSVAAIFLPEVNLSSKKKNILKSDFINKKVVMETIISEDLQDCFVCVNIGVTLTFTPST